MLRRRTFIIDGRNILKELLNEKNRKDIFRGRKVQRLLRGMESEEVVTNVGKIKMGKVGASTGWWWI